MKPGAKKKIQLVLLFGTLAFAGLAQTSTLSWEALGENSNRMEGKLTGLAYRIPPLANSIHFLQDSWVEGNILLEDGDLFDNLRIRYLAFHDELVVYNPNLKQLFIVDKEKVNSFTFNYPQGEQKFVKLYFDAFVDAGYRYFDLKYQGSRWLVTFHYIYEEKTSVYRDAYGKLRDSRLQPKKTYFMYFPEEEQFRRVQSKRRWFIRFFPENKREVRRMFRKNNLRRFDEKEMIQAFELLDENGFFN
ncbi:MAG: hypothetical protein LC658_15050 [Bacteroidales bacterium]|nr:hypothetical protein [Bacteroidales bacterium]